MAPQAGGANGMRLEAGTKTQKLSQAANGPPAGYPHLSARLQRAIGPTFTLCLVAITTTLFAASLSHSAFAETARLAVATNFAEPAHELAERFANTSRHKVTISTGSTGALYAQIKAGAPFDIFLAADTRRPAMLEEAGDGVRTTRFTYAVGRIAIWSRDKTRCATGDGHAILARDDYHVLAIADPKLAPYGAAAKQMLEKLALWASLKPRLVFATNIGQAFAHVATGNAELGVVALSQLKSDKKEVAGSYWLVPSTMHDPIKQDAIMLKRGTDNAAAKAFYKFLKSDAARSTMERYGYEMDTPTQ